MSRERDLRERIAMWDDVDIANKIAAIESNGDAQKDLLAMLQAEQRYRKRQRTGEKPVLSILICSTGAQPISLTFPDDGAVLDPEVVSIAKQLATANEVYAVRVFDGEQPIYEWGGE